MNCENNVSFYQSSTPTLIFLTETDLTNYTVTLSLQQFNCEPIVIEGDRVNLSKITENEIEYSKVSVKLTQEETSNFVNDIKTKMQLKAYTNDDNIIVSNIVRTIIGYSIDKRMVGDK